MHRNEPVELAHIAVILPVGSGVETQRLAAFFDHPVEPHIVIVVHWLVAHRRHHEARDLRMVGILFDDALAGFRVRERQVEHRIDPVLGG